VKVEKCISQGLIPGICKYHFIWKQLFVDLSKSRFRDERLPRIVKVGPKYNCTHHLKTGSRPRLAQTGPGIKQKGPEE
jgi:hypothetical protein